MATTGAVSIADLRGYLAELDELLALDARFGVLFVVAEQLSPDRELTSRMAAWM